MSKVETSPILEGPISSSANTLDEDLTDEELTVRRAIAGIFDGLLVEAASPILHRCRELLRRNPRPRLFFARSLDHMRSRESGFCVHLDAFDLLCELMSVSLLAANEQEDYGSAKTLMNMTMTYYHESAGGQKVYVQKRLVGHSIWKNPRFWDAAFFDAVRSEDHRLNARQAWGEMTPEEQEEAVYREQNLVFGQLVTFAHNMLEFGVSPKQAKAFVERMCVIYDLPVTSKQMVMENVFMIFPDTPENELDEVEHEVEEKEKRRGMNRGRRQWKKLKDRVLRRRHVEEEDILTEEEPKEVLSPEEVKKREGEERFLKAAADEDGFEEIQRLVEEYDMNVECRDEEGCSALLVATMHGNLAVVHYLLDELKVNVHTRNDVGATALHRAAWMEFQDLCYSLVLHGADINALTDTGWTPLAFAVWKEAETIVAYLIQQGARLDVVTDTCWSLLHFAAGRGHENVCRMLCNAGADVNALALENLSPLHFAAARRHTSVVKVLLEAGCDPNLKDAHGVMADEYPQCTAEIREIIERARE